MKLLTYILLFILSAQYLLSQSENKSQLITLNLAESFSRQQEVPLSRFVDKITYIPLESDKLFVSYLPHELLKRISINSENQGFSKNIYSQLNEIKSNLSETDNPVLLIGVPKKKLQILK